MRNREAAAYSRWAAVAAALVVLTVVGVYAERAWRQARVRRSAPAAVPASVEQQSAQFTFSKVEQDRTIFTIRASQATRYRDQNHALLEDVWITVYGRDGNRNDNIHTRECTYESISGQARCEGAVQIDIADAATSKASPPKETLELTTSNLSFNHDTGEASTTAPVIFSFPGGTGHGTGVDYSTKDSIVHVGGAIEFDLVASPKTGGMPVAATGSSLEVRRDDRTVILNGPVDVRQGVRDLAAEKISVQLDENNRAQRVVADGNPTIHSTEDGKNTVVSAAQFEGLLNPAGWVERIVADERVAASRESRAGTDRFLAAHVEFAMVPGQNLIQEMTATGGVTAESVQKGNSQILKTDSLRVAFATGRAGGTRGKSTEKTADHQSIESVETLAPGTIETKSGEVATVLRAKKFVAQVNPNGRLSSLAGHSAVDMRRQTGKAEPQDVSASEMKATFGPDGDWASVEESGNVQFQQADRKATADRAQMVRATDAIALDGSPVISDSLSRTTASGVEIDQKTGEFHATGDVISTYMPPERGDAVSLGSGPAHISADSLSGSVNAGHAAYIGHARLWQGDSVLDADRIELWRDEKKMQAVGEVVAVFPQNSGPVVPAVVQSSAADPKHPAGPTLWKVQAPVLTYWSDQGRAHLSGGVVASSQQGVLQSRTLDIFLGPPAAPAGSTSPSPTVGSPESMVSATAGRQLTRVLAQGSVVVRQEDRRGTAEQAEYTAADGKFVLSGGQPTVTDDSSNTVTGHSLTFFVASDTILVDSQEGSRTLTKHRVEK